MCKQCEKNPVYEFTNQRKLCRGCFVRYFEKKFLYIIRKFKMLERGDKIEIVSDGSFRGIVLKYLFEKFEDRFMIEVSDKGKKVAVSDTIDKNASEIVNEIIYGDLKKNLKNYLPMIDDMRYLLVLEHHSNSNRREEFEGLKKFNAVRKEDKKIIIKPLYLFLEIGRASCRERV